MSSVNRIILVGRAGAPPETNMASDGETAAYVSLPTSRTEYRRGEIQQRTDWHRIVFRGEWIKWAQQNVRRSTRLYIEGHLEYGSVEGPMNVMIPVCEVMVEDAVALQQPTEEARAEA